MKITPEKYFRMLRMNTLRRPSDVLYFVSAQDTLLSMANAQAKNPSLYNLSNWKESPKTSLGRLVKHLTFSVSKLRWAMQISSSTRQRTGAKNEQYTSPS